MRKKMIQNKKQFTFSRAQLKWIAAITMLADHVGYMLVPPLQEPSGIVSLPYPLLYYVLRLAGRLSFPIVCFMLVEGAYYTHNRKKYLFRLLLAALLSEIPFDLALYGKLCDFRNQNVLFTLVIGLAVIFLIERALQLEEGTVRIQACLLIVMGGIFSACLLGTDYSYWGILLILAFYLGRYQSRQRIFSVIILCAAQGLMEAFAAFSLFITERYDPQKPGCFPKYFFYVFYPVHLLILLGIQCLIKYF